MGYLYSSLVGLVVFTLGAGILGRWLRSHRTRAHAERASRVMHFLFFAGLVLPATIALFIPGVTHFDRLVGVPSLSPGRPFQIAGFILLVPGLYFLAASNRLLRTRGAGTNAFRLTRQIVASAVYQRTRNPMSFGYYLCALALGLITGSTVLTLGVLFGLIPAHLFFLMYFEALELELRFGATYLEYQRTTPFLIPRWSIPPVSKVSSTTDARHDRS